MLLFIYLAGHFSIVRDMLTMFFSVVKIGENSQTSVKINDTYKYDCYYTNHNINY